MDNLVVVRGGGDIATGTIYKLARCGFHILVLEIEHQVRLDAMLHTLKQYMMVIKK